MSRITTENVAAAIRKVSSLSLPQKVELAGEIHRLSSTPSVGLLRGASQAGRPYQRCRVPAEYPVGVLSSDEGVGFAVADDH